MLARNAESLYWIGRYVERADDTAGILDVTVHQLLEDSSVDPDHTSRVLLRVRASTPRHRAGRLVADRPGRVQPRPARRLLDCRPHLGRARKRKVGKGSDVHGAVGVFEHHLQRAGRT